MSNTNRKLKKRKDRERRVRHSILNEREKLRAPERVERQKRRQDDKLKEKRKLIERELEKTEALIAQVPQEMVDQINRNIETLKALEDEYNQEMARKAALNEDLEKQGHLTLEEKIAALRETQANNYHVERGVSKTFEFGGSAICTMTPNPNPSENS